MARLNRFTETAGLWLARALVVLVTVDLLLLVRGHFLGPSAGLAALIPWLVCATAVLPVAVASLSGLRFQSECARLAVGEVAEWSVLYAKELSEL